MTIYLHVGSHKTGTTAIQDFAFYNTEFLAKKGLLYPNLDMVGLQPKRSHLDVVEVLASRVSKKYFSTESTRVYKSISRQWY